MLKRYLEVQSERDQAFARKELAHAMAAVHLHARDEDDFVGLMDILFPGQVPEEQFRHAYQELERESWKKRLEIERGDVNSIVEMIVYFFGNNNSQFSVNDFMDLVPPLFHAHIGKALRRLRSRLEPVGLDVSRAPSRKGGVIRTWRFRDPE